MTATGLRRAVLAPMVLVATASAFTAPASAAPVAASQARVTATFADQCRDVEAHSSKDISHVELHYRDGRVVKDESMTTPDYALDGAAGDEIAFAIVKSGTTVQTFPCTQTSRTPTARLEINVPELCHPEGFGDPPYTLCYAPAERTVWLRPTGASEGHIQIGVDKTGALISQSTWVFRATGSTDPDGDISGWTIDFGDGTPVVSGNWTTQPPSAVPHYFEGALSGTPYTVTLTVTDSAGNHHSDSLTLHFFDITPD